MASSLFNFDRVSSSNMVNILFKNTDLDFAVRVHLARVYAVLAFTIVSCVFGCVANFILNLGGVLSTIVSLGFIVYLGVSRQALEDSKRIAIIGAFGFFLGCSLGPLIASIIQVDPGVLFTAIISASLIFTCFSLSALWARRRQYLFLGAVLSSAMSWLFLLSVLSLVFSGRTFANFNLYVGLFVFCGYVVFDTQMIIEKASAGDRDYIWHAMELFIDLIAIFVRICIILLQNTGKKRKGGSRSSVQTSSR